MNPVHSETLKRVLACLADFEAEIFDPDAARDDMLDRATDHLLEASTVEIDGHDDLTTIAELCERAAAKSLWLASKFRADARHQFENLPPPEPTETVNGDFSKLEL